MHLAAKAAIVHALAAVNGGVLASRTTPPHKQQQQACRMHTE
jgi:hypothetical protein